MVTVMLVSSKMAASMVKEHTNGKTAVLTKASFSREKDKAEELGKA